MAEEKQTIQVPDIGGAAQVDVIEILIKPGDAIKEDDSLVTLEGDKASMEIPSPISGVVETISMKVGDKVAEGDAICVVTVGAAVAVAADAASAPPAPAAPDTAPVSSAQDQPAAAAELTDKSTDANFESIGVRRPIGSAYCA